ncbi:FAS1-like dehydratase domain-containing protein [Nocardioides mesophilus]|uniref:MaoC family dehydratase N-terminal domain-containing protein n=1 Tax=Nocardioides mesophilus TaxID=433659 RepID=A0A7G9RE74_9ACTN|nr:MaoC family dehydratase N-terminal domain-containing protein [Nocardioides mesophilus]QNN53899.1 MaoC family dehydratase N-terminal domain-containing protein [Nocardioides mesophilus]
MAGSELPDPTGPTGPTGPADTDPEAVAVRAETLVPEPAEALAGLLDIDPVPDGLLPPLWHWVYLLERRPQRDLGPDGHPVSGIPAPPGPGRRRMFAGGRVETRRPLVLGRPAERRTRVLSTTEKQGRTGPLTFVTVRSEISQDGAVAVVDEQDIVYRSPGAALPAAATGAVPPPDRPRLVLEVDEALLFRFSALTYNAHRIHYDRGFVAHEGYADLVVHGPLQALMMGELFRRNGVDLVGRRYAYRLVAPMIGPQPLTVAAAEAGLDTASPEAEAFSAAGAVTARSRLEPAS